MCCELDLRTEQLCCPLKRGPGMHSRKQDRGHNSFWFQSWPMLAACQARALRAG